MPVLHYMYLHMHPGKKIVKMATEDECYDVIVLGAGVEGSSTAYYLTNKAGIKNVLLLEQVTAE